MKTLFRGIDEICTLAPAAAKQGRRVTEADLGRITKAALLVERGKILWVGEDKKIPKGTKAKEVKLKAGLVLPGFIECHTHLIFAGSRAAEFELRNTGVSYQEIAAKGGGILSTMKATRAAGEKQLLESSQKKIQEFVRQGVTTVEVKSGYALNLKDELKVLKVAGQLKPITVVPTFLGAHALPPEFPSVDAYLDFLADKVLPEVKKKKLSNRVDIFIEKGFFEKDSGRRYLQKAKDLGFELTIHADQITLSGGTELARELGALSADHVIQLDENQITKIARSDVTAVLLPAADLYMKCTYPKARAMIDAGARVALATDFNPGTSPTQDINLVGLLARLEMKMTLPEVISAYTIGAAHALKLQGHKGSLESGKDADFICINGDISDLFYAAGKTPVSQVYGQGRKIFSA